MSWRTTVIAAFLLLSIGVVTVEAQLKTETLWFERPSKEWIEALPGKKFFIRGNHDYWFGGPAKVRAALGPSMRLVRFDAHVERGVGVCGVRGWLWPGHPDYEEERDRPHWVRAIKRLHLSLEALARLQWSVAVAMIHYPPLDAERTTELCDMIRAAGVRYAVYGHVHGEAAAAAFEGEADGVSYLCVSADKVAFGPALLFEHQSA